tara:strand:+ start:445 stop:750 length:306 start_codon:yes stop_codon:yes gene_type:complete
MIMAEKYLFQRISVTDSSLEDLIFAPVPQQPSLEELQDIVGGYVEMMPSFYLPTNIRSAMVNEEGQLRGLLVNRIASELFGIIILGDVIVEISEALHWGSN